ncbi:hypothetical protein [Streptomyces sp. NBC_00459]|uniref:hypothetical protein n=1 Tax=Streptomyces sp. NBC_00459 TaxID=2975749 RepID=UPI002E1872AF
MSKFRTVLVGAAMAATALLATPGIAQADGGCNSGEFCAYADDNGTTYRNAGNDKDWPETIQNKLDWVSNRGTGSSFAQVNIYYNENYTSAYACLGQGHDWNLRNNSHTFNWTAGNADGKGKAVHDNAASHKWVNTCGNNT